MADTSYARLLQDSLAVPPWMRIGAGNSYLEASGRLLDLLETETYEAAYCRLPTRAPEDALAHIGKARLVERYPGETLESYRFRVWDARTFHEWSGTNAGIITQLKLAFGLENITIRENEDWDPEPPDGNTEWNSRFWVVIGPPHDWKPVIWGEFTWGDGSIWGGTITSVQLEIIKRILRKQKDASSYCEALILVFDDGSEMEFPIRF